MLRPQDTATRERKRLDGLWRFALDPAGQGRTARWFAGPLADAREMAVPASFNDIAADPAVRDYFGDAWYQRPDEEWTEIGPGEQAWKSPWEVS